MCTWAASRLRGSHSNTVLQMLHKMVLQMARLLFHALHQAGVGLLMRRLWKLRVKLLHICGSLLHLLPLLLLQRC